MLLGLEKIILCNSYNNSVCLLKIWGHLGQHVYSMEEAPGTELPLSRNDPETNPPGSK